MRNWLVFALMVARSHSDVLAIRGAAWDYGGNYLSGNGPARVARLTRETLTNISSAWAGAMTNVYDPVGNRLSRLVAEDRLINAIQSRDFLLLFAHVHERR